ncbi:Cortactin-Binding Protein 2 [Manis pentadactyla]|nr:Cortactin-Binding Protein 2 [Manis pentadactyla]
MPQHEDEDQYVFRPHIRVGSEIEPTERLTNPNPSHDNWTCTFTVTIGITRFTVILNLNLALAFISETSPKSVHKPILPVDLTEHNNLTLGLDTLPEPTSFPAA